MTYIESLSEQIRIFLQAFGFGFLLGFLYDFFRLLRLTFTDGKKHFLVGDILYFVVCTAASFLLFLVINDGKVRAYTIVGELLGWLIYYFSVGIAVMKASNFVVRVLKKVLNRIERNIILPLKAKINIQKEKKKKNIQKSLNKSKKIIKNSRFLLKIRRDMVYNLKEVVDLRKFIKKQK